MSHKIFVSYKYHDDNVAQFKRAAKTTVRDYVDQLQDILDKEDEIFKGEPDGEDLSNLTEDAIWEKLKDRIYDSTCTILMISKGMRENKKDIEQWIPWEISYSLKEVNRKTQSGTLKTSSSNAIIALVLPDLDGSYDYYLENKSCCQSGCRLVKTDILFGIVANNMFNKKKLDQVKCDIGSQVYSGEPSYIISVKWDDFKCNVGEYIDRAYKLQNSIEQYDIEKEIE